MPPVNIYHFPKITEEEFLKLLTENDLFEIEYTCEMVHIAQEPLDMARDYLQALYLGERLAKHSKYMVAEEIEKAISPPNRFVIFGFMPNDPHEFYLELEKLSKYIADEPDDYDLLEFGAILEEYEESLSERSSDSIIFPDLFDIYRFYMDMSIDDEEDEEF